MTQLPSDYFNLPVAEVDPEIAEILELELNRQQRTLEMIASENFVPVSVLEAQGSVLTNKYAEGYPGRRYYGGCEFVDMSEQLAIDRAKALFGAEHANVQPHAGAQANIAVYQALLHPGRQADGVGTGARRPSDARHEAERVRAPIRDRDLRRRPRDKPDRHGRGRADRARAAAEDDHRRLVRLLAATGLPAPSARSPTRSAPTCSLTWRTSRGWSLPACTRRRCPYADVVATTIHKTIGGPRSGMILCREEYAKKIDSAVFPGQQGGPLEHVIAAKAVALKIAASDSFRERQERTVAGAKQLAESLLGAGHGVSVLTGGTDVHLILVDLRDSELDGQQAEDRLHSIGITVNRNAIPFDPRPPMVTSGLRIGTPALATRGLQAGRLRRDRGRHRGGAFAG